MVGALPYQGLFMSWPKGIWERHSPMRGSFGQSCPEVARIVLYHKCMRSPSKRMHVIGPIFGGYVPFHSEVEFDDSIYNSRLRRSTCFEDLNSSIYANYFLRLKNPCLRFERVLVEAKNFTKRTVFH